MKRLLAKEWLWLLGSLAATFALFVWALSQNRSPDGSAFIAAGLSIYGLTAFVRLTIWAINTVR